MEKGTLSIMADTIVIQDKDFKENNISFSLKKYKKTDVCTLYKAKLTYDNNEINEEFSFFKEDIDLLESFQLLETVEFIYFIEPDLSFTLIDLDDNDILLYINLDSGITFSNIATDSGLSIRINTTVQEFKHFINALSL